MDWIRNFIHDPVKNRKQADEKDPSYGKKETEQGD